MFDLFRVHQTITANPSVKAEGSRGVVCEAYLEPYGDVSLRIRRMIEAYGQPHVSEFTGPAINTVEKLTWTHPGTRSTTTLWVQH